MDVSYHYSVKIFKEASLVFFMFAHDEVYDACRGNPPSLVLIPPRQRGGRRNKTLKKLRENTAGREYVRPCQYTSEFRRDVSDIRSSDRGNQRRRWPSKPGVLLSEAQREKQR